MATRFIPNPNFRRKYVPDMKKKAGMRQGAIVRTIAKRSIRKPPKKKRATSGPPRNQTGALKNFIRFAWDATTQSVVVGPVDLPKKIDNQAATLEFGGQGEMIEPKTRRRRRVRFNKRPFMRPALEQGQRKYPDAFRGTLP